MTWRVARSLDVLLGEVNTFAPHRSKVSDGSIGDAAHAIRSSDHNPWRQAGGIGVVGARDFTHDPTGGLDCQHLAEHLAGMLATGQHPALASGAYIIWRRRILSRDRLGEGWRAYYGSNPHEAHLHLSVATSATGFDSLAPWGYSREDGADVALDNDDVARLARAVWNVELTAEGGDQVRAGRLLVATHKRAGITDRLRAIEADAQAAVDALADDVASRRQVQRLRDLVAELRADVERGASHDEA